MLLCRAFTGRRGQEGGTYYTPPPSNTTNTHAHNQQPHQPARPTHNYTHNAQRTKEWLAQGLLQRLVLIISSALNPGEVLERWTFEVETDAAVLGGG